MSHRDRVRDIDQLIPIIEHHHAVRSVSQGIADPKKVAIYGGSYGGYAALVGATLTPDLFCCAVDIVGPSNLITLVSVKNSFLQPYQNFSLQQSPRYLPSLRLLSSGYHPLLRRAAA